MNTLAMMTLCFAAVALGSALTVLYVFVTMKRMLEEHTEKMREHREAVNSMLSGGGTDDDPDPVPLPIPSDKIVNLRRRAA
jgi:hypothetical protein